MTAHFAPLPESKTAKTLSDQVFDTIYHALITFDLEPTAKISEANIAKQMGISRQPVREAFFRLAKLGFLHIRPQRATLISQISEQGVAHAAFIRTALEVACIRQLCQTATVENLTELRRILVQQATASAADDHEKFHALDDHMHERIVEMSGHAHVWPLIDEQKAHLDRIRFLSQSQNRQTTFDEHKALVEAIAAKDADAAQSVLEQHLGRIHEQFDQVRSDEPQYFEGPVE